MNAHPSVAPATERLIANSAGVASVAPGEIVDLEPDLMFATDISAPATIDILANQHVAQLARPEAIALFLDHLQPADDPVTAAITAKCLDFAASHGIKRIFDLNAGGISHVHIAATGIIRPGDGVVGSDSHTTMAGALGAFAVGVGATDLALAWRDGKLWFRVPESVRLVLTGTPTQFVHGKDIGLLLHTELGSNLLNYRSLEISGETCHQLELCDRLTLCNFAADLGAKNALFADNLNPQGVSAESYHQATRLDITALEPQVMLPFSGRRTVGISQIERDPLPINKVYIGGCSEGGFEDIARAVRILSGNRVAKGVDLVFMPGSSTIIEQLEQTGLAELITGAGAVLGPPVCGPCIGRHLGRLQAEDSAICTYNRNTPGRMGHRDAKVYLSNAAVAAAAAVAGAIVHPSEVL